MVDPYQWIEIVTVASTDNNWVVVDYEFSWATSLRWAFLLRTGSEYHKPLVFETLTHEGVYQRLGLCELSVGH